MQRLSVAAALAVALLTVLPAATAAPVPDPGGCTNGASPLPFGYYVLCVMADEGYGYADPTYSDQYHRHSLVRWHNQQFLTFINYMGDGAEASQSEREVRYDDGTYSSSYEERRTDVSTFAYVYGLVFRVGVIGFVEQSETHAESCDPEGCTTGGSDSTWVFLGGGANSLGPPGAGASVSFYQSGTGADCQQSVTGYVTFFGFGGATPLPSTACPVEVPSVHDTVRFEDVSALVPL